MEVPKLSVFIVSSSESLPVVKVIEDRLRNNTALLVQCWTAMQGDPGELFINDLIKASASFDAAVIVIAPEDLLISRGEETKSPRDNVLFELGLFMGNLGRERAVIVGPNEWETKLKIMSDIVGLNRIRYGMPQLDDLATDAEKGERLTEALQGACDRLEAHLEKLLPRSIFRGEESVSFLTRELINSLANAPRQSVRTLRNMALDMDQTWGLLHDNILMDDTLHNIRIEVLMIDAQSTAIQAFNSETVSVEIAAKRERSIARWCKENATRLARRDIEFTCRAYADVPLMHGFLVNKKNLMISLCKVDVEKGELVGAPNPYLAFEYPAHELRDRTAIYLFDTFNSWFDYRWAKARPIWPAP